MKIKITRLLFLLLENNLRGEGVSALLKALEDNRTITELDVSGIYTITDINTKISCYSDNNIKDSDSAIFKSLEKNTTLTRLNLSDKGITISLDRFKYMFHTDNKLGDECAKVIGNVLYTNTTLTDLDLSGVTPTFHPIQQILSYRQRYIKRWEKDLTWAQG